MLTEEYGRCYKCEKFFCTDHWEMVKNPKEESCKRCQIEVQKIPFENLPGISKNSPWDIIQYDM